MISTVSDFVSHRTMKQKTKRVFQSVQASFHLRTSTPRTLADVLFDVGAGATLDPSEDDIAVLFAPIE